MTRPTNDAIANAINVLVQAGWSLSWALETPCKRCGARAGELCTTLTGGGTGAMVHVLRPYSRWLTSDAFPQGISPTRASLMDKAMSKDA